MTVELRVYPPPPEIIGRMAAVPRVRMDQAVLVTQQGPDGGLGPESAGAILILQATFTEEEGARHFWDALAPLTEMLAGAPGFIRRYSFADGPSLTLIALWRTAADARVFASTPEHRAAARALYEGRWEYSHFAGIWELTSNHGRVIFCRSCDAVTAAEKGVCDGCGTPIVDVFREPAPA